MQIPTAKYWMDVRNTYGRVGGRIEVSERGKNSTEIATETTKLDPWELSESGPPTLEYS